MCSDLGKALVVAGAFAVLADAADPAENRPDPQPEASAPLKVAVRPESVTRQSYLHFDENGKPRGATDNMSMSFSLNFDEKVNVIGYRNLKIDPIITDQGEALIVDPDRVQRGGSMYRDWHNRQRQARVSIALPLPIPTRPATSLRQVSGSVEVQHAVGTPRQAVLAPLRDMLDKRVHVKGIADSLIVISREADNQVQVLMSSAAAHLVDTLVFADANGVALPIRGWGGDGGDGAITRRYQLALPDDARVIVTFLGSIQTTTVPFALRDVPLPVTQPRRGFDLMVDAHAPGEAPPAARGPEQLEIVVEDAG